MGSRHQPSNLPRLFPDKDIHKLKWHSKKARTAARLTTSWLTGPAGAHYKMYVFGEVRSLLSLAFCCFEAQAQKDWEATSQTSKVQYMQRGWNDLMLRKRLFFKKRTSFKTESPKKTFPILHPAFFLFHPAIPPQWTFLCRSHVVKPKFL